MNTFCFLNVARNPCEIKGRVWNTSTTGLVYCMSGWTLSSQLHHWVLTEDHPSPRKWRCCFWERWPWDRVWPLQDSNICVQAPPCRRQREGWNSKTNRNLGFIWWQVPREAGLGKVFWARGDWRSGLPWKLMTKLGMKTGRDRSYRGLGVSLGKLIIVQ